MEFRKVKFSDAQMIAGCSHISDFTCENTVANILIWAELYNTEIAVSGETVFVRFSEKSGTVFTILCGDIIFGVKSLQDYCRDNDVALKLWLPEGSQFDKFVKYFCSEFDIYLACDLSEYIYKREDMANLSGKRFHSKRNHISSFSRRFNWTYEDVTDENRADVLALSERWYNENTQKHSNSLYYDNKGTRLLLDNMKALKVKGGIIRVDGQAVAFCLGTPINNNVFDINFEKALSDYPGAYAVINNEFAKRLDCTYINREDDMGVPGLRKAKLSYHPDKILKKYICYPKTLTQSAKKLYSQTFKEDSENYIESLFERFFPQNCYFAFSQGEIRSILFALPAKICDEEAVYIYGAATDADYRGRGLMKHLLDSVAKNNSLIYLKPAEAGLFKFYEKMGYKPFFTGSNISGTKMLSKGFNAEKIQDIVSVKGFMEKFNKHPILCDEAISLTLDNYEIYGGNLFGIEFLAVTDSHDKLLDIKALFCEKNREDICGLLCEYLSFDEFNATVEGDDINTGMILCDDETRLRLPKNMYLGIALD